MHGSLSKCTMHRPMPYSYHARVSWTVTISYSAATVPDFGTVRAEIRVVEVTLMHVSREPHTSTLTSKVALYAGSVHARQQRPRRGSLQLMTRAVMTRNVEQVPVRARMLAVRKSQERQSHLELGNDEDLLAAAAIE